MLSPPHRSRMPATTPQVVVIGGPNGAGKTTVATHVLRDTLQLMEFVNADAIARGLSAFDPSAVAMEAGRVMLHRLRDLASRRASFAFETTLASRTFAPWLRRLRADGYDVHVLFIWLRSSDLAIRRVRRRVRQGGHDVPPDTIRRRYLRGTANFVNLYAPLATTWRVYDNSGRSPTLVATGGADAESVIHRPSLWRSIHDAPTSPGTDDR